MAHKWQYKNDCVFRESHCALYVAKSLKICLGLTHDETMTQSLKAGVSQEGFTQKLQVYQYMLVVISVISFFWLRKPHNKDWAKRA